MFASEPFSTYLHQQCTAIITNNFEADFYMEPVLYVHLRRYISTLTQELCEDEPSSSMIQDI